MTDKPRPDRDDKADPGKLTEQRETLKAEARRDEAALREQPEDRRASARQTTPAGKGRSK